MILATSTIGVITISIVVFLVVILLLVLVLLFARQKLIPQGDVKLQINDRELTVSPGNNLMSTMSSNGIFLPSACGGGGTCAQCRVNVLEGGGSILPTETGHINKRQAPGG